MITKKAINKYESLPVQVRASLWFLICSFLQKGISVITTPIFTRLMTPSEYGNFGVFNSWLGIITIVMTVSLYQGVHVQGLIKFNNRSNEFSSSLQGLTTTMILLWTIIYYIFLDFWNDLFSLNTIQMLSMFVMIWTTAVFSFWANEQRVKYSYKTLVLVTIAVSIAKPILEIVLILILNDSVTARIIGIVIAEVLGYTWMFIYQLKNGKKYYSAEFWKYALFFNIPLVPHYLSQVVLNSADRIMIQNMVGNSEAGIYNLAYSLALIMTLFNNALSQTINPWIYQKIKEKNEKEIAPVAYSTLLVIAVVNLLLIVCAPEAVAIFAPKTYYDAIWVIPPVAMSVFFMFCYDLFAKFAFYYEKTVFVMIASIVCALTNLVLNYFAIARFGYVAAGYTTLICFLLYASAHYIFMIKVCNLYCEKRYPYNTRIIIAISVIFAVCGFLLLLTYNYPAIRYGAMGTLVIAIIVMRKRISKIASHIISLRKR